MTGKGFALLIALVLASPPSQAQHNVRPDSDNPYNTHISGVTSSRDFRCNVYVETIWAGGDGAVYVAFSNDSIWYHVSHTRMLPLLYTAYSLGKKVCYQTKGKPSDDIVINILTLDPRS